MSKTCIRFLVLLCTLYAIPAAAQTSGVFISEYIEGSSNNKAIEIYNGTGAPLNLGADGYNIQMYFNGNVAVGTTVSLTGVVAAGDVFVLAQSSANATILALADQTNGSPWYNGDDAVVLRRGTTVLDVIGVIGTDPGTEWGTGLTSTADNTLRRKATVCAGDSNGADTFDPSVEWTGFATDDVSNLGAHTASCGTPADLAPTVTSTTPTNGATNVSTTAPIVIKFSEDVDAPDSAFTIECPAGTPQTFVAAKFIDPVQGTSVVLTPFALPYSTACTVTVDKNGVSDTDATDPPDHMDASKVFTFTTAPAQQADLTASSLQAGATSLDPASNIIITFSRSVTASASAFSVSCMSGGTLGVMGSPGQSITLDPSQPLPFNTDCTVTAFAAQIFAAQAPTQMASDYVFTFHTAAKPVATNVMINEVDADTPGDDRAEFIELYGPPNTDLDGLVVVLYNGVPPASSQNNPNPFEHQSYASFDLDGYKTDANGYFVLGNPGVANAGVTFDPGQFGLLQNGPDAVALYAGNATDFPNGTPSSGALPTSGLVDAVVYDTDDADDLFLKALNGNQPQINENASGDSQHQSIARCENGSGGMLNTSTYLPATPTPGAANVCPSARPHSDIVISQIYGGGGNSNATFTNDFVELHNTSTVNSVDTLGWTLQYASAGGTNWTNKQPLGGIIGPGEYYLIKLASQDTNVGAALPVTPNIAGSINLSGTSGKVALVSSGESLAGECPIFNPNLKDFVGYGSANCGEGNTKAPAPSNTSSVLRNNGGDTDTDNNHDDFTTLSPPAPRRTTPIQELPPFVFATDPAPGGLNVPRDPTIVLTFTEPVDVDPGFYNIVCDSGTHNSASVAGSGAFKDITLNDALTPGEHCTVTIDHTRVHDSDTDDPPLYDLLPEDVSWTFTVATGAAPPYSPDVHMAFGNPNGATADLNQPNNYLMMKPEFALSYDNDLGRPNWVSWHLSNDWIGTLPRIDTFRADPAIPDSPNWYRVESFDFSTSGFDRGHMTPNADRDQEGATPINQATFLMTNMVAQAPDNNQGPWAKFEDYIRTLMPEDAVPPAVPVETYEAYIVAGPVGIGGTGSSGPADTIAGGHVTVPSATWKVVLLLPKGSDDLSRVDCSTRTIAVIMPNVQGIRNDDWDKYLTTVDAVENLTGYDFFSNLPTQVQQCIESGTNGNNPPLDMEPPTITLTSPASNAVYQLNRSVLASYSCADGGSGLASCTGTGLDGAAIDTSSIGAKAFTVNATDVAGNTSTATVAYTVLSNAISISNVPTALMLREDSFVPAFNYAGDGATSVTSLTPKQCTVEDGAVVFQKKGTCTIVAHAAATTTFDAADGPPQSFEIDAHKIKNK